MQTYHKPGAPQEQRANTNNNCMLAMLLGSVLLASAALFGRFPGASAECTYPCVPGSEEIMKPKEHGTSHTPEQDDLRWGCDRDTADRICNFNRHYAEYSGYWEKTSFLEDIEGKDEEHFYDSNTGNLLFTAPRDRSWDDWIEESKNHGWPSFRDTEVNWDYVRVLPNGETVSVNGTHLVSAFKPVVSTAKACFMLRALPIANDRRQE